MVVVDSLVVVVGCVVVVVGSVVVDVGSVVVVVGSVLVVVGLFVVVVLSESTKEENVKLQLNICSFVKTSRFSVASV